MNSCVCDMPGMNHSLTKIKYSLPFLGVSSLPLMSLSDFIFWCPSQLLLLFFPFGICPCFPASHHSKSYCLHCTAQMPPPPGSLFSQELCALDKNTDNRSTTRGRSLPTLASSTFCLGQTQTSRAFFSPTPQYTKVPTRW